MCENPVIFITPPHSPGTEPKAYYAEADAGGSFRLSPTRTRRDSSPSKRGSEKRERTKSRDASKPQLKSNRNRKGRNEDQLEKYEADLEKEMLQSEKSEQEKHLSPRSFSFGSDVVEETMNSTWRNRRNEPGGTSEHRTKSSPPSRQKVSPKNSPVTPASPRARGRRILQQETRQKRQDHSEIEQEMKQQEIRCSMLEKRLHYVRNKYIMTKRENKRLCDQIKNVKVSLRSRNIMYEEVKDEIKKMGYKVSAFWEHNSKQEEEIRNLQTIRDALSQQISDLRKEIEIIKLENEALHREKKTFLLEALKWNNTHRGSGIFSITPTSTPPTSIAQFFENEDADTKLICGEGSFEHSDSLRTSTLFTPSHDSKSIKAKPESVRHKDGPMGKESQHHCKCSIM